MMKIKTAKAAEDELRIESVWPQLKNAINWLLKNQVESAVELTKMVICRRRKEKEEDNTKVETQVKSMLVQITERKRAEIKKVLIEVCC